jgi:hypothetical protein
MEYMCMNGSNFFLGGRPALNRYTWPSFPMILDYGFPVVGVVGAMSMIQPKKLSKLDSGVHH